MTAHDAPSFASAIEGLLASDSNRVAKGKAARQLVLNQFSWKAATSTLVELLRQEATIH